MPEPRHFTTRRGFVATLGFGAVSLYGAWAAFGAAPLPFIGRPTAASRSPSPSPAPQQPHGSNEHGEHAHHSAPAEAEGQGAGGAGGADGHSGHGGASVMTPEEFRRAHDTFIQTYAHSSGHGENAHAAHAGHSEMAGHGSITAEPTDIYLLVRRFSYSPDLLHLTAGVPYRFRLMADDITHGASLQLGAASRIIRLRPNIVTEQMITFTRPGTYLVYCTVYCGLGHDAMHGRIRVA